MGDWVLVGGAADGHCVRRGDGLFHQVLRSAHAVFQPEEAAGAASERDIAPPDAHAAANARTARERRRRWLEGTAAR